VTGITLTLTKSRSGSGTAFDSVVTLSDGSSFAPDNKAAAGAWPASFSIAYGGPTDTWGRAWTGADVKASGFGWVMVVNGQHNDSFFADFNALVNCGTVEVCYLP
jgi:hypothetical protein